MRHFASLACFAIVALGCAGWAAARPQTITTSSSPLEIQISGPRQIHRGFPIRMDVKFSNRSAAPLALRPPIFYGDDTRIAWAVTDGAGRILPPPLLKERLLICPVTGPLMDWNITVLGPGETLQYEFAGDPSDAVVFGDKGFYRISLHYVMTATNRVAVGQFRPPTEQPATYTPEQKVAMIRNAARLEATSNEWVVFLAD